MEKKNIFNEGDLIVLKEKNKSLERYLVVKEVCLDSSRYGQYGVSTYDEPYNSELFYIDMDYAEMMYERWSMRRCAKSFDFMVIVDGERRFPFILECWKFGDPIAVCGISKNYEFIVNGENGHCNDVWCKVDEVRPCFKSEEKSFLKRINEEGYSWDDASHSLVRKPKFKIGDIIIDKIGVPFEVVNIFESSTYYMLKQCYRGCLNDMTFEDAEKEYHLWTIDDAREGDCVVLTTKDFRGNQCEIIICLYGRIKPWFRSAVVKYAFPSKGTGMQGMHTYPIGYLIDNVLIDFEKPTFRLATNSEIEFLNKKINQQKNERY